MKITVYGVPVPKGRPKVAMRGKFPIVYTPKETREAEDDFLAQVIKLKPDTPLEGPLKACIKFYKIKPKSYPKNVIYWTKKPDLDNLIKLVLDAMNNVFFKDDSQIIELTSSKEYSDVPRTEVTIETFK